jgi:regulatory protein
VSKADATADDDDVATLEAAAIRLLASREHSRAELERKLAYRFGASALVGNLLDDLQARELLSEQRFVENYIDQRHRKGFGPQRIRVELAGRGLSAEQIESGFDALAIDWESALARVAEQKFGVSPAGDRGSLAKRGRFLEQRGFPVGLIRRYLDRTATA